MKKSLKNLVFGLMGYGILYLISVQTIKYCDRQDIRNICREVGYNNSVQVEHYNIRDLNCDGLLDVALKLETGDELKFLNLNRGYKIAE